MPVNSGVRDYLNRLRGSKEIVGASHSSKLDLISTQPTTYQLKTSVFPAMARRGGVALLVLVASLAVLIQLANCATETPPKPASISFPPSSKFVCSFDPSTGADIGQPVTADAICTPVTDPPAPTRIVLGYDNNVISARYQYKTPVQLWKRNSKYVASFSAFFSFNFDRSSEYDVKDLFSGGGLAFCLTPSLSVLGTGQESFGLFPIDETTGASLRGKHTKTVALEFDISTIHTGFDPKIPHMGLDINSVKSVKSKYLGDSATVRDMKYGVWVEYDALKKTILVFIHKVKPHQTPKRQNANLAISYTGLDLAKEVKEFSYVGISSRIPEVPKGVYIIYDFKFTTKWVLGTTVNK